jgi:uncharacterized protein (TIGR02118 family)
MMKFMVVLNRKPGTTPAQFRRYLERVHGPMAEAIPGLRRYVQNHVVEDPRRANPGWDAVVELYWDDRDAMEQGWASAEGRRATADLEAFADPTRTTWSIVDEQVRRRGRARARPFVRARP